MKKNIRKKHIQVSAVGIAANLVLFFVKLYIGLSSNSISIYLDSLNNLLDSVVCIVAAVGFGIISIKVSEKFPFGYGRAEDIIYFVISVAVFVTGGSFAYSSLERLMYPAPIWYLSKYAVVIAATAVVKLGLMAFYRIEYKKLDSPVIKGLSLDSILDFFITLSTLVSFTLSEYLNFSVDGVVGIVISLAMIVEGIKMTVSVCGKLLGKRDNQICKTAENIILNIDNVESLKNLQCHAYGGKKVFTADIATKCQSAEEIVSLEKNIKEQIKLMNNSEIYLTIGEAYENRN